MNMLHSDSNCPGLGSKSIINEYDFMELSGNLLDILCGQTAVNLDKNRNNLAHESFSSYLFFINSF